jgi:dihydroorotate dehydrogenase (NAD+) catalytic subunit
MTYPEGRFIVRFMTLPRYDIRQSYQWNYDHAPEPVAVDVPVLRGEWTYCGRPVGTPLGVAAGPLLNGRWCIYYAGLGFDVVTYKTVRSGARACYPLPNLQPIAEETLHGGEQGVQAVMEFGGSWAISFGMPSQSPATWSEDIAETRRRLPPEKLLSVSVVGTIQPGWSLAQLADDYAFCAGLAAEHGADIIEINLSCPNVTTPDGQLYQQPRDAALIAQRVRETIGARPLVAKIGHFADATRLPPVIDALAERVDAIATTNCLASTVKDTSGSWLFQGQPRGIGGRAIFEASVRQVESIANHASRRGLPLRAVGVGGIVSIDDVRRYLSAGAEAVQLATAVMIDPEVGLHIRARL